MRIEDGINTSEYILHKGNLNQGFYFVELRGRFTYRGKLVID
jgi:hypothetical protein